jgi:hypothetical protein
MRRMKNEAKTERKKKRWGARKVDMAVHGWMSVGSEFVCFSFPCVLAFLPHPSVHPWDGSHRKEEEKKTQGSAHKEDDREKEKKMSMDIDS